MHVPVLLDEVVEWLDPRPGMILVDGTLGAGGHARALAERIRPGGLLLGLDRDPAAVEAVRQRLVGLPIRAVWANFCDLPEVLRQEEIEAVDGVLLDLGWSGEQMADPARGFSFDVDGPLDMRLNPQAGKTAAQLIARLAEKHLADLIYHYGEERYSRRIARKIVETRRHTPIETTAQLAALVRSCVPRSKRGERIDPATRTFQALRIAVNDELKSLEIALRRIPECLKPGGRLAVISFHSLEDRRVKDAFRQDSRWNVLTKKPLRAGPAELIRNPRSRSAKLRVAARK